MTSLNRILIKTNKKHANHITMHLQSFIPVVEHDPSYDEFKQNTGIECSFDDYEDAYTWITIHAIDKNGKKIKVFEMEPD